MPRVLEEGAHDRAARRLLRLMPGAVDHSQVRVDGVRPQVTPADVAAALAGLSQTAVWVAYAKYDIMREVAESRVRWWLVRQAYKMARRHQWLDEPAERIEAVARLVADDIFPPRCDVCRGRGQTPDDRGLPQDCPACRAWGVVRREAAEKARLLGVGENQWHKLWRRRYERIVRRYNALDGLVKRHLDRRL